LSLARSFAYDTDVAPGLRPVTIMRTGYDRSRDVQLAFRCGDYTGWHGHPDQGSFVLNAYEERLVIDRALGAPYGTPTNDFSKSALAHSIVLIDDEGQVPYSSPVFHDHGAGHTGPLLHTKFIDYIRADSTVAYRKNPQIRVMDHAYRHFLFVRNPNGHAYAVIIDDIQMDDQVHRYDWLLQTDTKHTIVAEEPNHQVITGESDTNKLAACSTLHIFTLEPERVEMSQSESHNLWRGLKLMNPNDVQRGLFLNILYPKAKEMPLPEVKRLDSEGFVGAHVGPVEHAAGLFIEDTFLFATQNEPISGNGIATDGQIAVVRHQNGEVESFLCVAGTRMEVDGQELFRSDKSLTLALDKVRNGRILSRETTNVTISLGGEEPVMLTVQAGVTVIEHGVSY
jgi:hypothetical protein